MADKIGCEERETSLYLIQIQYLDKQLERCQLKCDELERQNKDLASQYSALEKDKRDITEYLKHSVVAKEKKAEELAEQLESQQQAAERDAEALKLQHSQQIQELQDRVDELNSECGMKVVKFEEQQEQLMQLKQQLSDMEYLEKQLVSQKEEHEAAIDSLKKKAKLEWTRMNKEIQNTLSDCVQMKTSHIVQEERAQHSERLEKVQVLLNKNMDLWEKKDALLSEERDLRSEITKLKKDVNKITKESLTHGKEVEQLKEKCQQLEVQLMNYSIAHQHLLAKKETLSQRLTSVSEECRQNTAEAVQLGTELQEERSRRRQLEGDVQEAVIILRHILTDSEEASETQWRRLLDILESTAPQGTGSTLEDSTEKSSRGQIPQTADPKPARAETLNLATNPLFLMARYRPGDLGLVPRPTWKHKPAISRTGARSTSTPLPLNRKLCCQTSSSVDPAPAPQQADPEAEASTSAGC